jgi:hypothetical protein
MARSGGKNTMLELLILAAAVAVWLALGRWVLPRLGVPT